MRFSLRLNNDLAPAEYVALARAAEDAGFDQIWVSNDLFLRSAPVVLATMAVSTRRIEVGSGILNPYTINASELAMLAATMDEVSGNRFNLGLSVGAPDFLKWVGIRPARPLAVMRETIGAVRTLLRGERAPVKGGFLEWAEEAYLRFAPPRSTPVYLGAMGPRMLALAGELADGVLPLLFPPEHYFAARPLIAEGEAKRGAALGPLDVAACIWVSLADDRAAARRALAEKIAYYGRAFSPLILGRLGLAAADFDAIERAIMTERDTEKACRLVEADERMMRIGVVGEAAEVVARLEPLVAAGARHLSFGPPLGPDPLQAVRLLGRDVVPHFR
ncbi:MAG TPA: LLM class flavin-dependent oxidoreductase [Rhodospirillales bacterium]|jgi:5,10-methylenetetrahydromethanopterin reductase|nr:LLM class flavin-dependent oxidoreductase [Rhodospirillales bacterium]HJO70047.1 LLM class flavin-dependent oxidoreductase [Rhodospirillales bacterium]